MNVDILRQLAEKAKTMNVYPDVRFPPSLYYRFLRTLAEYIRPSMSVELGVAGGGGLLHLALGWPDGLAVGIEHGNQHLTNIACILNMCRNTRIIVGDSRYSFNACCFEEFEPKCVDILFIDTVHTYAHVTEELNVWLPYLKQEAVVCLDDLYRERMAQFWNELPYEKIRLDWLHVSSGSPTDGGFGAFIVR